MKTSRVAILLAATLLANSVGITALSARAQMLSTKTTSQSRAVASRAKELAKKVIGAYGGQKNINKFFSTPVKELGNLEQISSISGSSNKLACEVTTLGLKQLSTANFMGQKITTCFDGEQCWTMHGKVAMPTDPITARRIKEDLEHGLLLLLTLTDPSRKLEIKEDKRVKGKKCKTLVVTADDGQPTYLYIDPKSHLIVKLEYKGTDSEQGTNCQKAFEYEDYRDIEGFMSPFKVTEYSDEHEVSCFQVNSVEANLNLPDDFFDLPHRKIPERLKAGPVVIPFKLMANQILIKAKLNGEKEFYFLVDTGATQSVLDVEAAKSLGIVKSGDYNITTGSGSMKMQFMTLDSVRLGDLTINQIPVAVAPMKKFSNNLSVKPAGLIGANILKRFILTIDYPKEKIELRAGGTKLDGSKGVLVDTKPSLGVSGIAVEGVLDDTLKLTFLLDSGAGFNHVSEDLVKDLLVEFPILPVGFIKGLDAKMVSTGAIKFKNLKVGNLNFKDPVFSIAPTESKKIARGLISGANLAIIGNPLLAKYRISIDYQSQKILFEQSESQKQEDSLLSKLNGIKSAYYENEDLETTVRQLTVLKTLALKKRQYGVAGEAIAEKTFLLCLDNKLSFSEIDKNFTKAIQFAMMSKNKSIQARILSKWALYYLERKPPQYLDYANALTNRAIHIDPTESEPYSTIGLMMVKEASKIKDIIKTHKADKPPKAVLLFNLSLMLNPSNWNALWAKYDIARESGQKKDMVVIGKLLKKYWPEAKKVQHLVID